ncbi:hypothetical protein HYW83_05800 [Candidatus Peregrinibacteria bacterium]|nr:hypothetical protein [Candidatus Peregrinibacteria bacterium]
METPQPHQPKRDKPRSGKSKLVHAVAISGAIHGGALAIVGQTLTKDRKKDEAALQQAKQQFSDSERTRETTAEEIPADRSGEEEFETLVAEKIAHADNVAQLRAELIKLYQQRLRAFNQIVAEDIQKDGIYDGNYAEFLMKTNAYSTTLENLRASKLEFVRVTKLQQRWKEIVTMMQHALQDFPERAEKLDRLRIIQNALVRDGVIEDYSEAHARFEDLLLGKKGNCDGISNLSMAIYRELFGRQGYFYRTYTDHMRTQFTDDEGNEYLFENTAVPNEGKPLGAENDKGLKVPAEALMVSYLETQGFKRRDFPKTLQAYWKQKQGKAVGGGKSNSLWGEVPNKGYCTDGSEECFVQPDITFSLKQQWEKQVEVKAKTIMDMTLAEMLDADFFTVDRNEWDAYFGDSGEIKPISLETSIMRFRMDEEKLKARIIQLLFNEVSFPGDIPDLQPFPNLTIAQLKKLKMFLAFSGSTDTGNYIVDPAKDFESAFIDVVVLAKEQIDTVLQRSTKDDEIVRIQQIKDPHRQLKAFKDFVREHGEVPEALVDMLDPRRQHLDLVGTEHYGPDYDERIEEIDHGKNIGISIKKIAPSALRKLIGKSHQGTVELGLTEVTPEIIDVLLDGRSLEISLPNLVLNDPALASYIGKKLNAIKQHVNLEIGGFGNPESARAFIQSGTYGGLHLNKSELLTPAIAKELSHLRAKILSLEPISRAISPEIFAELSQFSGISSLVVGDSLNINFNGHTFTREQALALKNARAHIIRLIDIGFIEDPEVLRIISKAAPKEITLEAEQFSEEVVAILETITAEGKVSMPSLWAGHKMDLLIKKYRQPPPEETKRVEQSGNFEAIQDYMYKYGRLTPAMADTYCLSSRLPLYSSKDLPSFKFVEMDEETAEALRQAMIKKQQRDQNRIFTFDILEISPAVARILFSVPGQNPILNVTFVKNPSEAVLHAIIEANPAAIIMIHLPNELTPLQAKILGMHPGDLTIDCESIPPESAAELIRTPRMQLDLEINKPLTAEAAAVLSHIERALGINQIASGAGKFHLVGITEEAAKVFARQFQGQHLFLSRDGERMVDRYR